MAGLQAGNQRVEGMFRLQRHIIVGEKDVWCGGVGSSCITGRACAASAAVPYDDELWITGAPLERVHCSVGTGVIHHDDTPHLGISREPWND
jgi:hypothetical protein